MSGYTQDNRKVALTTPLGKDVLLFQSLKGTEAISEPFRIEVQAIAECATRIPFDKLLGRECGILMKMGKDEEPCYLSGVCAEVHQGMRTWTFARYRLVLVPEFQLLDKKRRSRIFVEENVPGILKKVLEGQNVSFELGETYEPRDFCVQYRESDFDFASRLMEEEGIRYYFEHTASGHKMILSDNASRHPTVPGPATLTFEDIEGGLREKERIYRWEKAQSMRSGKITLWDHCFEIPHKNLESQEVILDSVVAGTETHRLRAGGVETRESYDWPGRYAQRFDGIDRNGGPRPAELSKIFRDGPRTAAIRMDEETVPALTIQGMTNARHLRAGHRFVLKGHFNGDGPYFITATSFEAEETGNYRTGRSEPPTYKLGFTCLPAAVPYRPRRKTPLPRISGPQSAVVVGPPGEEIFTDKYGRVKVQFHWDRDGKHNQDSSCWIRTGTMWAGRMWGMVHIPRIGQEVIVAFLEGDPDQPIIVGSTYNSDMMPPYPLPANKTQSGLKSRSSPGGGPANFNELRFEDKKGSEQVYLHAEKNEDIVVENDKTEFVGHDETIEIGHDRTESVGHDETLSVGNDRTRRVGKNEAVTIGANRTHGVGQDESISVGGSQSISVGQSRSASIGQSESVHAGRSVSVTAGDSITLSVGPNSITIDKTGIKINGIQVELQGKAKIEESAPKVEISGQTTEISGQKIKIEAGGKTEIKGGVVKINC
ncbi:MAG: type VI secretion system tip protein VgrG [Acidobacteria bacterium]|nr:type VI secretion system tip protein VgrG [Acidobacteriota bacterium]